VSLISGLLDFPTQSLCLTVCIDRAVQSEATVSVDDLACHPRQFENTDDDTGYIGRFPETS
jgi:hypothetical protein